MSLPSQVSHMWQFLQPVVLRCGHLQDVSASIMCALPKHSSTCILHTLRRSDLLLAAVVPHTSKEELVTTVTTVRNSVEFKSQMSKLVTMVNKPALKGHFANTLSSGRLLPGFALHWRSPWLLHNGCWIYRSHSFLTTSAHSVTENSSLMMPISLFRDTWAAFDVCRVWWQIQTGVTYDGGLSDELSARGTRQGDGVADVVEVIKRSGHDVFTEGFELATGNWDKSHTLAKQHRTTR